jgi:hypothetical protein
MDLKPGTRLRSVVGTTEVVVVRDGDRPIDLRCGGHPMVALTDEVPAGAALAVAHSSGTQLGKRYTDPNTGLELLCTRAGEASLAVGDKPLLVKHAKPLPSSD